MTIEKIKYIGPQRKKLLEVKGILNKQDFKKYINEVSPQEIKKELKLSDKQYDSILYTLKVPRFLLRFVPSFDYSVSLTDIVLFFLGLLIGYWLNEKAAIDLKNEMQRLEMTKTISETQIDSLNSKLQIWQSIVVNGLPSKIEKGSHVNIDTIRTNYQNRGGFENRYTIGVISSVLSKNNFRLYAGIQRNYNVDFKYYFVGKDINYFAVVEKSISKKYTLLFNINLREELRQNKLFSINLVNGIWNVNTFTEIQFEGYGIESQYLITSKVNLFDQFVGKQSILADVGQTIMSTLLSKTNTQIGVDSLSWSWEQ